jgi:peptide/nickel transport system permease protein
MKRTLRYAAKRVLLILPQVFILVTVVFALVHLLPGDPVFARMGGAAPLELIENYRHQLGLDQPIYIQYFNYLKGILHGDLGTSWLTGDPVVRDLTSRLPATLELLLWGMGLATLVGIGVGVITALRPGGLIDRVTVAYALLAGAMPEFYIGLVLVFFFYYILRIAPSPSGRLDLMVAPPPTVTGLYLVDSAVAGQWGTFLNAAAHLALPVATLAFWQSGAIMKMTRSTMLQVLDGDYMDYARVMGLKRSVVARYALRNSLPPIVSLTVTIFAILLGSVVLIERVFAWGGLGQYSVQAVVGADYEAVVGFLMLAAVVSLLLFMFLDIIYVVLDPRLEL